MNIVAYGGGTNSTAMLIAMCWMFSEHDMPCGCFDGD